jgi:hypothetical protein
MDRMGFWPNIELWPVIGYFTTLTLVILSLFLCLVFLIRFDNKLIFEYFQEDQVYRMGPLIDAELEAVDRRHAQLTRLSTELVDALNLYHQLMHEDIQGGYGMPMPNGGKFTDFPKIVSADTKGLRKNCR